MTSFALPPIEDLDVEDLRLLPKGYRYELHDGNLLIMTPSTYWHKLMAQRLFLLLHGAGHLAIQDPGVKSGRPRDCRLPDVGVVSELPPRTASYSNLPGSAFSLIVEVVSENSLNGEYTDKAHWYARQGIPEYWIAELTGERADDDAKVLVHHLRTSADGTPTYTLERTLLLSELEAEYRAADA